MAEHVKISVVIPVKGRSNLFEMTVQSLLGQTCAHWEALVVDDRSPEEEFSRIEKMAGVDSRIQLKRNIGRSGACACRNAGLAASSGDYVVFLDSDDLLAPTCLANRVAVMEQHPEIDFAVFPSRIFHESPGDGPYFINPVKPEDDIDRFLRTDVPWHTMGPIWRKTSLPRVGWWDERARTWQDGDFSIRALLAGLQCLKLPEPDSYWRAPRPGSITYAAERPRHVFNRIRVMRNLAAGLRAHDVLTERRRRILAAQFMRHAFWMNLKRRQSLKIWRAGWRDGIVRSWEFAGVLPCLLGMKISRRATPWLARCLWSYFPELRFNPGIITS